MCAVRVNNIIRYDCLPFRHFVAYLNKRCARCCDYFCDYARCFATIGAFPFSNAELSIFSLIVITKVVPTMFAEARATPSTLSISVIGNFWGQLTTLLRLSSHLFHWALARFLLLRHFEVYICDTAKCANYTTTRTLWQLPMQAICRYCFEKRFEWRKFWRGYNFDFVVWICVECLYSLKVAIFNATSQFLDPNAQIIYLYIPII